MQAQFVKDFGEFYTRNIEFIYKERLPLNLHFACLKKDNDAITDIMKKVEDILALE